MADLRLLYERDETLFSPSSNFHVCAFKLAIAACDFMCVRLNLQLRRAISRFRREKKIDLNEKRGPWLWRRTLDSMNTEIR